MPDLPAWSPFAEVGSAGPAGPTGPTGPAGGPGASGILSARPGANGRQGTYFATDDGPNGTAYLDVSGVWTIVGGSSEVAYAEVDADIAITGVNVPGLAIGPFTPGSRPIMVELVIPFVIASADGVTVVANLFEGATPRATCATTCGGGVFYTGPLVAHYRCAASSGARSFVVQLAVAGGAATAKGSNPAPMVLRAFQV